MSVAFTHLHVHTEYSLLDGSAKIGDLLDKTKELGMDSLAITDHGVMYGAIDFYKAAKDRGIKPIIGCEVYLAKRSRFDKEKEDMRYNHLVLLAENNVGYQNLIKMVSLGFTEGFYRKPRIDYALLEECKEGIIVLGACLAGPVTRSLLEDSYETAKGVAEKLDGIMGRGNFYLEIQDHGMSQQSKANQLTMRLAGETGIPMVATNDVHYILEEDAKPHEILLCIQTGKTMDDPDRMIYEGGQYYLKSPQQMEKLFSYAKEALENTCKVAERCHVEFDFHELKLPSFDVPTEEEPKDYLRRLCYEGLVYRYENITEELKDRLEYELDIIIQMGFVDYFLIVSDFIKYAKDEGIPVGPGRGSAAGSIVAYTLEITDIDPIKYSLLFERFLNPERVSMPDIDIDFCYERRQEVIDYVIEKYGENRVAQIITFGTMSAKAVIRDVGRATNMPYPQVDKIAKMIPNELKMTIKKALKMNEELNELYNTEADVKYLIDNAMKLEGIPRHSSTHAAGVVISKKPVVEYVPLNANEGVITTQYTMTTLEELGLLKMDFLGLRTLTVIDNAIKLVKLNHGVEIDFSKMEYDDAKAYELIASGNTEGIFQLESAGMKSFMKELCPTTLEDIIAGVSLYRPGPMDFIPKYVQGKKNKDSITYTHEALEPILDNTYGCIVYQEQVMQIVRDLGGYSLGRSDLLRRAMGKKKTEVMAKEREIFLNGNGEDVPGAIANGIPAEAANQIFDDMIDFAKYAFNKSHAAAYAVVAYQTAYLKAYYKVEFMAALMTSVMDVSPKIRQYIESCKKLGIEVVAPDINEGYGYFSTKETKIMYGLAAIKNVGKNVVERIVEEREKNGFFVSLTDFYNRMESKDTNKRSIESLILAGALDSLGGKRSQYMAIYKQVADGIAINKKNNIAGQIDLFAIGNEEINESNAKADSLPNIQEFDLKEILNYEKEVIGIYLSGHPLDKVSNQLDRYISNRAIDLEIKEDEINVQDDQKVVIGGLLVEKKVTFTKTNKKMAFITLEDTTGTIECIIFPNLYDKFAQIPENDVFVLKGRVSIKDDDAVTIIADSVTSLEELLNPELKNCIILKMSESQRTSEIRQNLIHIFNKYKGNSKIIVESIEDNTFKTFPAKYNVNINDNIVHDLQQLLGRECIVVPKKVN
ncbi:MAG: DNA polymerase III subunit alpha [Cellulosilyticaceae bacterium]